MVRKINAPGLDIRWAVELYRGCNHPCAYCYVTGTHLYRGSESGDQMAERITVKLNAARVLREELTDPTWCGEPVILGSGGDPYQPSEVKYRLTRQALGLFLSLGQPCVVLTKSTLILRDLEVLRALAEQDCVQVLFSLCSLDEKVWRHVEPRASNPQRRLQALARLVVAGVPAGIVLGPVLPDLTDAPQHLEALTQTAADHGARFLARNVSEMRTGSVDWYQPQLRELYPHITPQYLKYYRGRYHGSMYTQEVLAQIESLRRRYELPARPLLAPSRRTHGQLSFAIEG